MDILMLRELAEAALGAAHDRARMVEAGAGRRIARNQERRELWQALFGNAMARLS